MAEKAPREKKALVVSELDPNMGFKDALAEWVSATKEIYEATAILNKRKADKKLAESIVFPKIETVASRMVKWVDKAGKSFTVKMKSWMRTTHPWKQVYTTVYTDLLTEEQRVEADKISENYAKPTEMKKLVLEGYEDIADANDL